MSNRLNCVGGRAANTVGGCVIVGSSVLTFDNVATCDDSRATTGVNASASASEVLAKLVWSMDPALPFILSWSADNACL